MTDVAVATMTLTGHRPRYAAELTRGDRLTLVVPRGVRVPTELAGARVVEVPCVLPSVVNGRAARRWGHEAAVAVAALDVDAAVLLDGDRAGLGFAARYRGTPQVGLVVMRPGTGFSLQSAMKLVRCLVIGLLGGRRVVQLLLSDGARPPLVGVKWLPGRVALLCDYEPGPVPGTVECPPPELDGASGGFMLLIGDVSDRKSPVAAADLASSWGLRLVVAGELRVSAGVRAELVSHNHVTLIPRRLEEGEFAWLLDSCGYVWAYYANADAPSGVVGEAAVRRKPCVVPAGTTLAQQAMRAGVAIPLDLTEVTPPTIPPVAAAGRSGAERSDCVPMAEIGEVLRRGGRT